MEKKRSVGIIVFSILFILIGLFLLLMMSEYPILYIFLPIFSIFYLITGIGILLLKPIGKYLAITLSVLVICSTFISIIDLLKKQSLEFSNIVAISICLFHFVVIYYFTRPKVKEQFR